MIHIFKNKQEAAKASAGLLIRAAKDAVGREGRFSIALTGGSSPKELYQLLATEPYRSQVPWEKTHIFWGDERSVPHDDEQNNARMSFKLLLDHVPVPAHQIHRMSGELPPAEAAWQYEEILKKYFGDQVPQFDLILLGMGDDGHTASLFPGTPVLGEKDRWVAELFLKQQDMYRITLTAPLINKARQIVFQVFGENKAGVLKQVLEGPTQPEKLPSQLIKPGNGELHWFLDEAAAGQIATKIS
jgi:6-phosphogluconolactonase